MLTTFRLLCRAEPRLTKSAKEISGYEMVTGPGSTVISLWACGWVRGRSFSSRTFPLDGWADQDTRRLETFLKGRAEVCVSHIYPILLYRLSVLPLPYARLMQLVRTLFSFLWRGKAPMVSREVCCLHPSEGGLGMPSIEIRQYMLRITFLDRMCRGSNEEGAFLERRRPETFSIPEKCALVRTRGRPFTTCRVLFFIVNVVAL
ncbi:unnamed protein product [Acanthosepion pharaonis]|uniref:Uncharacterized protein n=1 Tax=Acanthosepion pharaonis TaxID=158019 RepID=A0A812F0J7_ACAPH|nr:unnamed protein product [Sepia pharaonis]